MHHVPQHHPPMPPTKAMGSITQNRHSRPTATPWLMSWYSGVVRFGRAREWGAYSGRNSAGRGVWYLGRITMGGPNWTVYRGPKNQPYHNQLSEASLRSANRPWDGTAALFVGTEIMGNIRRSRGVEGMANWRPGSPFQWVRPLSFHNNTTINLGSDRLGLNLPGKREAVVFCGVHFFLIMAGGEILRHH